MTLYAVYAVIRYRRQLGCSANLGLRHGARNKKAIIR